MCAPLCAFMMVWFVLLCVFGRLLVCVLACLLLCLWRFVPIARDFTEFVCVCVCVCLFPFVCLGRVATIVAWRASKGGAPNTCVFGPACAFF